MSAAPVAAHTLGHVPIRQRRAARVAGWALVILGTGHLLTVAATALAGRDEATRRALDGMSAVRVTLPGPRPTLAQLFDGYSLMMGVMVTTAGALVLLVARHAEFAPALLRAVLWATVVVAVVGLTVSWLTLPFPPLLGLTVALVAAGTGLSDRRR